MVRQARRAGIRDPAGAQGRRAGSEAHRRGRRAGSGRRDPTGAQDPAGAQGPAGGILLYSAISRA